MAPKALKRTGLVAGVTAGALGLAYAGERALVARLRHRDDPDADLPLVPEFDSARVLDSHDGGTIYTIERGVGPTIVFCHGVTLSSRVMFVKTLPAGARLSYGLRYELPREARIATVPAGYADGVPRNLGMVGGEVLIRGRRCPIIGMVTMDQLLVDLGDVPAEADDEVVLIGRQGDDEITATEWAERLGTISYEVVTGIGARVPRTYVGEQ